MFEKIDVVRLSKEQCEYFRQALASLYFDNVRSHSYTTSFAFSDAEDKTSEMINYVGRDSAVVFGGIDESGKLVGFIWAYSSAFRDEPRLYISAIQVDAACRGRGLGTKLLRAVEEEAGNMKLTALYIHAEAHNKDAIKLYEREGYLPERVQLRKSVPEIDHA